MFKIGEFSNVTGISIYRLRHYDKMGLLKPEFIDESSGYRYYSEKQIVFANEIQILKALGFGLKEIKEIPSFGEQSKQVQTYIQMKIQEKECEMAVIQHQIQQMKQALDDISQQSICILSVVVKKIPTRKVVAYRGLLQRFDEEGKLWQALGEKSMQVGVKFAPIAYGFAITYDNHSEDQLIDIEVQRVVEELASDAEGLVFKEIPSCLAATVAFEGIYSQIGDIKNYLKGWIKTNGYEPAGALFFAYYRSPDNENDPEKFITEICVPIKKA